MKIRINGNVATIISGIKFEALRKASMKNPLVVHDEDGNPIFAVTTNYNGSLTEAGAEFSFEDAEGYAALNLVADFPELSKEDLLATKGEALRKLKNLEPSIVEFVEKVNKDNEELMADMEVQ